MIDIEIKSDPSILSRYTKVEDWKHKIPLKKKKLNQTNSLLKVGVSFYLFLVPQIYWWYRRDSFLDFFKTVLCYKVIKYVLTFPYSWDVRNKIIGMGIIYNS